MKITKYIVLWHEDNATGVPKHVMGSSPLFATEEQAKAWIVNTVDEDLCRAAESRETVTETDLGDGVFQTIGNNQTCYYHIEPVEFDDRAAECIEYIREIIDPSSDHCVDSAIPDNSEMANRAARVARAIREREHEWMPMREWAVDIRFCPAACVHHVMARTAAEAEQKVNEMLDKKGKDAITDDQKAEMMDTLLENVESIEVVGPEDE